MWHPDIIHGVEDEDSAQQHPANVVYTAAVPMCPLNARCVSLLHRATPHASLVFIIPVTNDDLHSFFSRVLSLCALSRQFPSLFRYLVRQRAAFLDGIRPPDFCEGAVDKTCAECIRCVVFFS